MAQMGEHALHCDDIGCLGCECTPECSEWGDENFALGAMHERREIVKLIRKLDTHTTHSERCLRSHVFAERLLRQLGEDYDAG